MRRPHPHKLDSTANQHRTKFTQAPQECENSEFDLLLTGATSNTKEESNKILDWFPVLL